MNFGMKRTACNAEQPNGLQCEAEGLRWMLPGQSSGVRPDPATSTPQTGGGRLLTGERPAGNAREKPGEHRGAKSQLCRETGSTAHKETPSQGTGRGLCTKFSASRA